MIVTILGCYYHHFIITLGRSSCRWYRQNPAECSYGPLRTTGNPVGHGALSIRPKLSEVLGSFKKFPEISGCKWNNILHNFRRRGQPREIKPTQDFSPNQTQIFSPKSAVPYAFKLGISGTFDWMVWILPRVPEVFLARFPVSIMSVYGDPREAAEVFLPCRGTRSEAKYFSPLRARKHPGYLIEAF